MYPYYQSSHSAFQTKWFFPLQEAALKFLEDADQDQLTNLLAEVCPVDDENSNALDDARDELFSPYRLSAFEFICNCLFAQLIFYREI